MSTGQLSSAPRASTHFQGFLQRVRIIDILSVLTWRASKSSKHQSIKSLIYWSLWHTGLLTAFLSPGCSINVLESPSARHCITFYPTDQSSLGRFLFPNRLSICYSFGKPSSPARSGQLSAPQVSASGLCAFYIPETWMHSLLLPLHSLSEFSPLLKAQQKPEVSLTPTLAPNNINSRSIFSWAGFAWRVYDAGSVHSLHLTSWDPWPTDWEPPPIYLIHGKVKSQRGKENCLGCWQQYVLKCQPKNPALFSKIYLPLWDSCQDTRFGEHSGHGIDKAVGPWPLFSFPGSSCLHFLASLAVQLGTTGLSYG